MSIYRESESEPNCTCAFCQSSLMMRSMTYAINVHGRRLMYAAICGIGLALGILGFGAVRGKMAQPEPPRPPEECIETVDVRAWSNDKLSCPKNGSLVVIPLPDTRYYAICRCPHHDQDAGGFAFDGGIDSGVEIK